jgi:hypothetical protein
METAPYLNTFEQIQGYIADRFITTKSFATKQSRHQKTAVTVTSSTLGSLISATSTTTVSTENQLYLVVAYVSKGPPSSTTPQTEAQRQSSMSPISFALPSSSPSPPFQTEQYQTFSWQTTTTAVTGTSAMPETSASLNYITAGYALALYEPQSQALNVLDLILRIPTMQQGYMELDILKALVAKVETDVEMDSAGLGKKTETRLPKMIFMVMENALQKWKHQMLRTGFTDVGICEPGQSEGWIERIDEDKKSTDNNGGIESDLHCGEAVKLAHNANQARRLGVGDRSPTPPKRTSRGVINLLGNHMPPRTAIASSSCFESGRLQASNTNTSNAAYQVSDSASGPHKRPLSVAYGTEVVDLLMEVREDAACMALSVEDLKSMKVYKNK